MISTILILALTLQGQEPKPQEPLLPGEEPAENSETCEVHPEGLWEICEPGTQTPPEAEIDIPLDAIIVDTSIEDAITEAEAVIRDYERDTANDRRCAERVRLESAFEQKEAEIAQLRADLDALPEIDEAAETAARERRQIEYQSLVRELRSSQDRLRQIREEGGMDSERAVIMARIYEYTGRLRGMNLAGSVMFDRSLDQRQQRFALIRQVNRATEESIEIGRQLERARRQCQSLGE